jgi:hypothetical protein
MRSFRTIDRLTNNEETKQFRRQHSNKISQTLRHIQPNKWSNLFADEQKVNPTLCGGKSRGSKPQNASIEL